MAHALQKIIGTISHASQKQLLAVLVTLALLAGFSTVNRGLQSDDYLHRHMLLDENTSFSTQVNGFFEFLGPSETLPWWTHPDLKIRFWRPLSAASHWLDYQLWPNTPALMHWHNSLWYALLVALCFLFFNRLFKSKEKAFFAAFIFCIDFSHFSNISWIANRNSLIACVFILTSLICYLDWKKNHRFLALSSSCAALSLALLSAESGISLIGIVFIYELAFLKNRKMLEKNYLTFIGPLCFLLIGIVWFIFYKHSGFGSANNSMYFSPEYDLLHSLKLIFLKTPVFLFGNFFGIEGFLNIFSSHFKILLSVLCTLTVLILFIFTKEIFNKNSSRFLLAATIIPIIPVCFVGVLDMRLGIYSSIFSSGLLALIIISLYKNYKSNFYLKIYLLLLVSSHLFISPLQWAAVGIRDWQKEKISFSKLQGLSELYPESDIFVFNYPSPIDAYYFPFTKKNISVNEKNIYVLNNNLTNYQISAPSSTEILLSSEQGLAFVGSDITKLEAELPYKSGIYARAAFNGMLPRNFQFTSGIIFQREAYSVKVLDLNTTGLVSHLLFDFHGTGSEMAFLYWNTQKKNFELIAIDDLFKNKKSVLIEN